MGFRSLRLAALSFLGLALVLTALTYPVAAPAVTEPVVWTSGGIDYTSGTIALGARCGAPATELELWSGDTLLSTATCEPPEATVRFKPYRLRSLITLRVVARDAEGAAVWERPVMLDPADFRPLKPVLTNTPAGKVVPSTWTFAGSAGRPVTEMRVRIRQTGTSKTYPQTLDPGGKFSFTGRVPYGPATHEITAVNGFGSSIRKVRRVFYLGTGLPKSKRYVLVCKKTLWMYHIYNGRYVKRWPIAIGTPQTPTPTGTFKIGKAEAPGAGDWGVLRRRLWRLRDGQLYKTGYYIHGTYQPWTIGMMASHGCVRMYNKHVRQFRDTVPTWTVVKIR